MEWTYHGQPALVVPEGKIGFVYITHYTDGSYYIGKKLCVTNQKRPPLAAEVRKRKNAAKRIVRTELKWRTYEGSSSIKGGYTLASKEIVSWCNTKQAMTYIEADLQFRSGSLFDTQCLNLNILGKFFPNVLEGEDADG